MPWTREQIAQRAAQELRDGQVINLGIGIPTLVANYIPPGLQVTVQSENGVLGVGPAPLEVDADPELTNAGGRPITMLPGAALFDSALSFSMIRGGHIDLCVLGALQVDRHGNLANWMIPGKRVPGIGGAMDLVVGARRVIVAMEHTNKDGAPKIVEQCDLPLTAQHVVNLIITDLGVIEVTGDGLVLRELAQDVTFEEIQRATGTSLKES